jgi:hypothetical protein
MMEWLLGTSLLLSASQVAISGDVDCPAPADIWRYLRPLLPDTRAAAGYDRVVVEVGSESELLVTLLGADGVIRKRAIARGSACDHLAETVAVLIASWETELHPAWSPIIEPPAERPNVAAPIVDKGLAVSTTAGAWGSDAAGSVAPAISLGLAVGPRRQPWTARLSVTGIAAHKATLGPGEISYNRLWAAAGIGTTVGTGPVAFDVEAAVVGGAIVVTGRGFSTNETVTRPDVGFSAGARLSWRSGAIEPWAGVAFDIWPLAQEVRVAGWPDGRPLPRVEPRFGIGITALIWP